MEPVACTALENGQDGSRVRRTVRLAAPGSRGAWRCVRCRFPDILLARCLSGRFSRFRCAFRVIQTGEVNDCHTRHARCIHSHRRGTRQG